MTSFKGMRLFMLSAAALLLAALVVLLAKDCKE